MKRRHLLAQGLGIAAATLASPAAIRTALAAAPIVVGQSAALTGPQAGFGTAMRDGILAALLHANRNGGIDGRNLQLMSLDDQGDKAKTEANVELLTGNPKVLALTGFTTRPCSEAGAVLAAKEGIALVGAFSGTPLLYGDKAATTFTTRASYEREMDAIVQHYRLLGLTRFGFLHLEDARATNVPLLEKILAKHGGQLTVTAGVDRKGPGLNAAAIKTLERNQPEVLIALANNAPLTSLMREYAPRTLVLPKVVISFVDREKMLADLGKDAAGVGFSVVVPEYTREKYWVVREFVALAKEMKVAVTPVSLEGFITGLALAEGMRNARSETRASIIEGMGRVGGLDLGYTNMRFSRSERTGSRFVDLSLASRTAGIV
ncbi:ABC transporter substrate-binding protein [Ramlibacter sp. USB13]|uniref:ABC transporter substrate-binding protein n=1 Tax=Ramlibacter cellulosilyticus TaxID=2764187 RepID=A0A923SGJ6_9BURK|nr:ABC transporter substrate-binding protein [Ramlibacter cellulosilyticus]MBC5784992.1 ABC transporter substrate-binding protein [Ramlibacter cellulosilyticus]